MNVQHKLEGFEKVVLDEAVEKRNYELKRIELEFQDAIDQIQKNAQLKADEHYKSECHKAEQIKNKEIIQAANESKKSLIKLRNQMIENIYSNVLLKLNAFAASDEYKPYLIESIKDMIKNIGQAAVHLRAADMIYAQDIINETGVSVTASQEDFIGGFKAVCGNLVVDNSFKAKLMEAKQNYSYNISKMECS